MNYFHMTYEQVLESPMQRLIMLARSIPKYESKQTKEPEEEKISLLDFAKQNNLKIKKKE